MRSGAKGKESIPAVWLVQAMEPIGLGLPEDYLKWVWVQFKQIWINLNCIGFNQTNLVYFYSIQCNSMQFNSIQIINWYWIQWFMCLFIFIHGSNRLWHNARRRPHRWLRYSWAKAQYRLLGGFALLLARRARRYHGAKVQAPGPGSAHDCGFTLTANHRNRSI